MRPLIADTGGLLRALARDRAGAATFPEYETALVEASLVLVPALVLAEVDYFLRAARKAMAHLVADLFDPASRYEYAPATPEDLSRAMRLDHEYAELDLGLVDGSIAALAERRDIYRVLTTDRRDFAPLRLGPRSTRTLELLP